MKSTTFNGFFKIKIKYIMMMMKINVYVVSKLTIQLTLNDNGHDQLYYLNLYCNKLILEFEGKGKMFICTVNKVKIK